MHWDDEEDPEADEEAKEAEEATDAAVNADAKRDLTENEESVPKKTKSEEKEDVTNEPFWEKRRGVEGEVGPSVGGGAQKGAKSFPESGSGMTDGGAADSEEAVEGRQPYLLCSPCDPTFREVNDHQVTAHLPFRN